VAKGRFVALYRVSTQRQGRSGLGLEGQREEVLSYLNGGQWELVAEFTETVSGAKLDDERPELAAGIQACRIYKAKLIVSRLDRLSRDAAWLLGLERRGIDFVVASCPSVNRMTIGVLALAAEEERRAVSIRTKAALAARRRRGLPLGNPANLSNQMTGRINGAKVNKADALEFASDIRPVIEEIMGTGATSLHILAAALNARNIPTRGGSTWKPAQVARVLDRLGLRA
jgi:DNA invertase Pin-like site-specific DNA recombinase